MEGSTFDRLVRAVVAGGSRRRLVGLLIGAPLACLQSSSDVTEARPGRKGHRHHAQHQQHHTPTRRRKDQHGETHVEACIPTGQRCPSKKVRGKKGKTLDCNACCQRSFITETSGKKVCGCQPNGGSCTAATASSCCSGFCDGATCQTPPSAPCDRTCTGCCADGTCQPGTSLLACGTGGSACTTCSGAGVTCGGGGTPGVCGCTPVDPCTTGVCGDVTNNCGQSVNCGVCATITAFSGTRRKVDQGGTTPESATLSWSTIDATSCSIDHGIGAVGCNDTIILDASPDATTIYTLTAIGARGDEVTAQATVDVQYCHSIIPPSACPTGETEFCLAESITATSSAHAQAACTACNTDVCEESDQGGGGRGWCSPSFFAPFYFVGNMARDCAPTTPRPGDIGTIIDSFPCAAGRWAP